MFRIQLTVNNFFHCVSVFFEQYKQKQINQNNNNQNNKKE